MRTLFSLVIAVPVVACACDRQRSQAGATAAIEVRDDTGARVSLTQPATRIISLIPSATEVLLALGASDRLIARSDYDTDPRLAHLPSVGAALTPAIEWIAAAKPDLVIAWPDGAARSVNARLQQLGIPVYAAAIDRLDDTQRTIANLGRLLGDSTGADSLSRALRDSVDVLRSRVASLPRVRVLYLIEADPPMSARPRTFIDEMIRLAGGENVFPELESGGQQISVEEVVRRQPDVICVAVFGLTSADALLSRAGWRDLHAVRNRRVYVLDANVFNRPGPATPRNAAALARILHPEAFR